MAPGSAHQSLLLWAARRMATDGFALAGFDCEAEQAGYWNALPPPFRLHGVRADACGIRAEDGMMAFGEAKAPGDIDNSHTRDQLRVLGFTRMRKTKLRCPLYLAVPRSCAYALDRVLADVGLLGARHLVRLHVPEAMIAGGWPHAA